MKKFAVSLFLLILVHLLDAQPPLVTINGPVYTSNGNRFNGTVTITLSTSVETSAGLSIRSNPITVNVFDGAMTLHLVANDITTPASTYNVEFSSRNGTKFQEVWRIPSGGPYSIKDIRIYSPVTSSVIVNPSQLSGAGFSVGEAICWNGTAFVHGSCVTTSSFTLNGLTTSPQTFSTGTSGTNFNIVSSGSVHTFNLPTASSSSRGLLNSTDWILFNAKQSAITGAPGSWPSTFTPSGHAATHGSAGTDPVSLDASQIASGVFNPARIPAQTWLSITGKPSFSLVATSGSYLDLSNLPTIPAAQVNSDWTAGSGIAQILNKPSSFTPSTHAATHASAGTDPVSLDASQTTSGIFDTARIPAPIQCAATPGNTLGAYRSLCVTTAGSIYTCANSSGCSVSGDWVTSVGGFVNPMTTAGDLIIGGIGGAATRLGASVGYLNWNGSAFVYSSITVPTASSTTPLMDGVAAVGTGTTYARADHVHPTDASRQATLSNYSTISGLAGYPSSFTPSPHASTHASAGSDPVTLAESQVANLTTDLASKAASNAFTTVNGQTCTLGSSCTITTGGASNENVSFSATPTFSISTTSSYIVLTGNITSFTLASGSDGQLKTLTFCQDATGGRTVAGPANVHGLLTVGSTASKCSVQEFVYFTNQTAWLARGVGVINQ